VLMRRPSQLVRDMGLWPTLVFQVLIGGLILSSLTHPLLVVYIGVLAWQLLGQSAYTAGPLALTLLAIDIVNIFGTYAIFVALGRAGMTRDERNAAGWRWVLTPAYWLLMSLAAWRAVRELRSNPFFWNKTTHRPAQTDARAR
jgi:glycosyltransferase XagB